MDTADRWQAIAFLEGMTTDAIKINESALRHDGQYDRDIVIAALASQIATMQMIMVQILRHAT